MRAAIIGCGPTGPGRGGAHSISYAHARAMRAAGVGLVAAASRSEKNTADFLAEFPGLRGYQDYRKMLSEERPEFVSICAFPPDREAMVAGALEAGAKVLWIEKPFAVSMGAAHRMLEATAAHGARLFVNFQRRFGQPFEWGKAVVGEGRIGNLIGVQISQPGPLERGNGRTHHSTKAFQWNRSLSARCIFPMEPAWSSKQGHTRPGECRSSGSMGSRDSLNCGCRRSTANAASPVDTSREAWKFLKPTKTSTTEPRIKTSTWIAL